MSQKTIMVNKKEYPIPEGSTAEDTFEGLKLVMPELSNAKLEKHGDNWRANVAYGDKG